MTLYSSIALQEFLKDYPNMTLAPSNTHNLVINGEFNFTAAAEGFLTLTDSYRLEIEIPHGFPKRLPKVTETGGRIPRNAEYHVNPGDNTLCLGSPWRLWKVLLERPTLVSFAELLIVPYLYSMSLKLEHGLDFIFGELAHDEKGILEDCKDLFGLSSHDEVVSAFEQLGMKKRISNKQECPCGCKVRLGKCPTHLKLNQFRKLMPRSHFRAYVGKLRTGMDKSPL